MRKSIKLLSALLLAGLSMTSAQGVAAKSLVWGDTLPKSLDPHAVYDVPMQFYMLNTYDGLHRYVGNPPKLEPWLAKSHKVSDDGLTWNFDLVEGAKFHDGSEITAEDIVYSFRRVLAMGKAPSGAFKQVLKPENVTATDKHSVQFVLDKAYAPFLSALPIVAIVNQRAIQPNVKGDDWGSEWLSSNIAGSGPYSIDPATYRPQQAIDFVRFADHFKGWDHNANPIDTVKSRPVIETSTRVLALLKGEIHATDSYLPTDQVERVEKSEGVHVERDESMRIFLIRMNNKKPPFDNIHARKCFAYGFNYTGFIVDVLKNFAERNPAPIPKNLWGYPQDVKGYEYDPAVAQAECDKAKAEGAPMDREIEIHIQTALDQTTQAAQLLQSDMRKLGVNVKLVANTWPNLTSSAAKPESTPDMWVHWVSTYFVDPENWIGQMYDSQFHGTWKASAWYQNDKVDSLLREARETTDTDKRSAMYSEAAKLVVEDSPDIWIYNTVQLRGMSDKVKGYAFTPVGGGAEMRYMSLSD
jgi:peptide/nickel transport system substrate-binding protein